jgi:inorganic pyrophosphatase
MIVEIPQHSANKYEYDGNLGVFRLARALYSPLHYPITVSYQGGPREARKAIQECRQRYLDLHPAPVPAAVEV